MIVVQLKRRAGRTLGGPSPRDRSRHHVDARHRVRCGAEAGCVRAAGVPADLSGAGLGRARPGGNLGDHGRDRAWRDGEGRSRRAARLPRIGITNQRETTVVWDRATGRPIHNAIVWQDRRTADACAALRQEGHEALISAAHRAPARSVFLRHEDRLAARPRRRRARRGRAGRLAFGTVDSFLLWRLTGGKRARHRRDQRGAHAAARHRQRRSWDADLCKLFGVPRVAAAAGARLRRRFRHHRARAVRRADPHSRRGRRPAGGDGRAGLLHARHDEVDLRHRLLRAAQHRRRCRSRRTTGCSPRSPISSAASAPTRSKARSSSPARRCSGCATRSR